MNNQSLETIDKPEIESENHSIVDLFNAYCSHEFGSDTWSKLMKISEFSKIINHYRPAYGDIVFSELADTVSEVQNIEVVDLLRDFSNFIRTYY